MKKVRRQLLHDFLAMAPGLKLDRAGVKSPSELKRKELKKLFNQELCGLHLKSYFSRSSAKKASSLLMDSGKVKNFRLPLENGKYKRTDVGYLLGYPKRIAFASEKNRLAYFKQAVKSIRRVRNAFSPGLSPLDKLRLELDEVWSAGAYICHEKGETELAGILRHMVPVEKGLVHIDDFKRDEHRRAYSACLYLKVPKKGGELELWNISLCNENRSNPLFQICNTFDESTQEVIRNRYPKPLLIKPEEGDLIIFDAGRPHAVAGFKSGYRLVLQTFIVYEGDDKPLRIFA